MATTLGSAQKHIEDTPSETVRLLRTEFNALLDFVLSIVNAAETDAATFYTNVAALDMTSIKKIVASYERPAPPVASETPVP